MHIYNPDKFDDMAEWKEEMIKNLGAKIREIRRQKGLTQELVAELAVINPKYLGEIERGTKNPTVFVVQKIARALCVPICELVFVNHCPLKERGIDD